MRAGLWRAFRGLGPSRERVSLLPWLTGTRFFSSAPVMSAEKARHDEGGGTWGRVFHDLDIAVHAWELYSHAPVGRSQLGRLRLPGAHSKHVGKVILFASCGLLRGGRGGLSGVGKKSRRAQKQKQLTRRRSRESLSVQQPDCAGFLHRAPSFAGSRVPRGVPKGVV